MPSVEMNDTAKAPILIIDLAGIADPGVIPGLIEKATLHGKASPGKGSLRTLIDLSGTRITREIIASLKTLSRENGKYALASAFVGVGWPWSWILTLMFRINGKDNHRLFNGRDQAVTWLVTW